MLDVFPSPGLVDRVPVCYRIPAGSISFCWDSSARDHSAAVSSIRIHVRPDLQRDKNGYPRLPSRVALLRRDARSRNQTGFHHYRVRSESIHVTSGHISRDRLSLPIGSGRPDRWVFRIVGKHHQRDKDYCHKSVSHSTGHVPGELGSWYGHLEVPVESTSSGVRWQRPLFSAGTSHRGKQPKCFL